MARNAKRIEICAADGALLFIIRIVDEGRPVNQRRRPNGAASVGTCTSWSDSAAMTETQRDYLFQLLADRGIGGAEAEAMLKKLFAVEDLASVNTHDACAMIDRLVHEPMPN
jgi:hypothetical protein